MKTVRFVANLLFYFSRIGAIIFMLTALYAGIVILLFQYASNPGVPMTVLENGSFQIFYPFTNTPFLLGDYTTTYLVISLATIIFYGIFLWLLSGVFLAFRQEKLFTRKGVMRLSRFYITNLTVPVLLLVLLALFGQELTDIIRITFLHLLIGVFAFFMAAIFRQGVLLQEEQDLTF
jgi:hypothetical protein